MKHRSRVRATVLQPVLSFVARRNARARELAAAMQHLQCAACYAPLSAHIGPGNRWKGCPTVIVTKGGRTC